MRRSVIQSEQMSYQRLAEPNMTQFFNITMQLNYKYTYRARDATEVRERLGALGRVARESCSDGLAGARNQRTPSFTRP
jgi:hypothetical protein